LGVHSDSLANKGGCGVDIKKDGSANTSLTGHDHLGSGQRPSFVLTIVAVGLGTCDGSVWIFDGGAFYCATCPLSELGSY